MYDALPEARWTFGEDERKNALSNAFTISDPLTPLKFLLDLFMASLYL